MRVAGKEEEKNGEALFRPKPLSHIIMCTDVHPFPFCKHCFHQVIKKKRRWRGETIFIGLFIFK